MITNPNFERLEGMMEWMRSVPYEVLRHGRLYSAKDLYGGYVPSSDEAEDRASFASCYDSRVYAHYLSEGKIAKNVYESVARTLHDHGIHVALKAFLNEHNPHRFVGIMGGHALLRTDPMFECVVLLSKHLTEEGFLMVSGGGPGATSGDVLDKPAEVVDSGRGAARHTEDEIELHGIARYLAFLGHAEDGFEVTHLKALIFGFDTALEHAFAKGTHGGHGVVENLVAKIAGAAVKRGHLGQGSGVGALQTLFGGHAYSTTGGGNEDDVGTLFQDGLLTFLETIAALRGGAVVKTDVQVDDGSTGIDGRFCLANDFFDGIRYGRILLFGNFCATNCSGDNQFIHGIVEIKLLLSIFLKCKDTKKNCIFAKILSNAYSWN